MSRALPWPRSLPGQLAVLLAVALFVAQAINFTLLLQERQMLRTAQIVGPAVARLVDAADGTGSGGRARRGRIGPVARSPTSPIPAGASGEPSVAAAIAAELDAAGIGHGEVRTERRRVRSDDLRFHTVPSRRARRLTRDGAELVIAVERPGQDWLVLHAAWPNSRRGLVPRLLAQTAVLYIVVLLPVLWLGRRIARPLHALAHSARAFRPGDGAPPLAEQGPGDVRAVIAAHNALRTRVTAMLDEKDRMLGAIGHDLRTPLAALRVRIESVDDDEDRERMAGIIAEMSDTLEDILSFARLGRSSEAKVDTDLAALVEAVVDDFRDLDQPVSAGDAARLPARLRPTLMRRAVRNLIENAIKYAGAAEVQVIARPDAAVIEVADRGPGIPEEQREAVFEAFTRLEGSRNRETGGIGLGLALARAIVRDAGGELALAGRPGGGLLATIVLPR